MSSTLFIVGLYDIKLSGELHRYTPARTYPSDSEARPVGMSKTGCYRKIWSQSTAMMNYEFGSPFIPTLLGESANWPAAARARRGPGRGALGPFANQKNRRAQNDLGRSPPKAQHRPLGLPQTRPTRQKHSRTSLRDLPGRHSCAQEAQECPRATLVLRRYASMA